MVYRPEFWGDDPRHVTSIAIDVMATIRGSYDRPEESQERDVKKLEWLIAHWHQSNFHKEFDDLVYQLIWYAQNAYRHPSDKYAEAMIKHEDREMQRVDNEFRTWFDDMGFEVDKDIWSLMLISWHCASNDEYRKNCLQNKAD